MVVVVYPLVGNTRGTAFLTPRDIDSYLKTISSRVPKCHI